MFKELKEFLHCLRTEGKAGSGLGASRAPHHGRECKHWLRRGLEGQMLILTSRVSRPAAHLLLPTSISHRPWGGRPGSVCHVVCQPLMGSFCQETPSPGS